MLLSQFRQNCRKGGVARVKAGYRIHDLMIGSMVSRFIQLAGKLCQLLGVGGIVAHHVLHQSNQLLHGGVAMVVSTLRTVQMLMGMGMLVIVGMRVIMGMGVGMAVVSMLVGVGVGMLMGMSTTADVVVIQMHSKILL